MLTERHNKLLPPRVFWLILFAVLLLAGGLRYTGYNFSLPYIDHVDEPAYLLGARMIVDFGSPEPLGMHGYPPGIIAVNYVLIRLFHTAPEPLTGVLAMTRFLSVTFSMGTLIVLALLGDRLATPLVGLSAALLWGLSPIIVEFSRFGTADSFVTFFVVTALYLTLTGTAFDRNGWIFGGLVSAFLAIAFKYQAIFILPLLMVIPLWRWRKPDIPRPRILANFGRVVGLTALFGFWLVLLFPSTEATEAPDWSAPPERLGLPTVQLLSENFSAQYDQVATNAVWSLGWLGIIGLPFLLRRRRVGAFGLLVIVSAIALWNIGLSFFGTLDKQQFRQYISMLALLALLCAIGVSSYGLLAESLLKHASQLKAITLPRWLQTLPLGVVLLAVVLALAGNDLQRSINDAHNHTLPDRRLDLMHYMEDTLTPAPHIAYPANHKTLNPDWGGYIGQKDFAFVANSYLSARPIDDFRALGAEYAIIDYGEYQQLYEQPSGVDYLPELTVLKQFPPTEDKRGPSMVVAWLYPIENSLEDNQDAELGPLSIVGYNISSDNPHAGETLTLRYFWQADAALGGSYKVFNHLLDPETGDIVAQVDAFPVMNNTRPTDTWDDPSEIIMSQTLLLTLPDDLAAGTYTLSSGFYDEQSGQRLLGADNQSSVTITELTVQRNQPQEQPDESEA